MQTPLQIAFRNFERSEAIAAKIEERANKLESFCDGIIGCRVTVEALHKHHRQGNHYHVRVTVTVPGAELVADREPDEHYALIWSTVLTALPPLTSHSAVMSLKPPATVSRSASLSSPAPGTCGTTT